MALKQPLHCLHSETIPLTILVKHVIKPILCFIGIVRMLNVNATVTLTCGTTCGRYRYFANGCLRSTSTNLDYAHTVTFSSVFSCNVFKKCRFQVVSTRKRMETTSYDENVFNAKNIFGQAFSR